MDIDLSYQWWLSHFLQPPIITIHGQVVQGEGGGEVKHAWCYLDPHHLHHVHVDQVADAEKVVKRSKRQSQWTLLDPRTGRPVGWATIIIMTLIVIMMMTIVIIKMAALEENATCKPWWLIQLSSRDCNQLLAAFEQMTSASVRSDLLPHWQSQQAFNQSGLTRITTTFKRLTQNRALTVASNSSELCETGSPRPGVHLANRKSKIVF